MVNSVKVSRKIKGALRQLDLGLSTPPQPLDELRNSITSNPNIVVPSRATEALSEILNSEGLEQGRRLIRAADENVDISRYTPHALTNAVRGPLNSRLTTIPAGSFMDFSPRLAPEHLSAVPYQTSFRNTGQSLPEILSDYHNISRDPRGGWDEIPELNLRRYGSDLSLGGDYAPAGTPVVDRHNGRHRDMTVAAHPLDPANPERSLVRLQADRRRAFPNLDIPDITEMLRRYDGRIVPEDEWYSKLSERGLTYDTLPRIKSDSVFKRGGDVEAPRGHLSKQGDDRGEMVAWNPLKGIRFLKNVYDDLPEVQQKAVDRVMEHTRKTGNEAIIHGRYGDDVEKPYTSKMTVGDEKSIRPPATLKNIWSEGPGQPYSIHTHPSQKVPGHPDHPWSTLPSPGDLSLLYMPNSLSRLLSIGRSKAPEMLISTEAGNFLRMGGIDNAGSDTFRKHKDVWGHVADMLNPNTVFGPQGAARDANFIGIADWAKAHGVDYDPLVNRAAKELGPTAVRKDSYNTAGYDLLAAPSYDRIGQMGIPVDISGKLQSDPRVDLGDAMKSWAEYLDNKKAEGGVVRMNKLGAVKKGIEAARRGALSTFKDAPTKHIDDWMWNPMPEVAKDMPTEVSASADAYGDFMKKMSSIAGSEGLKAVRNLVERGSETSGRSRDEIVNALRTKTKGIKGDTINETGVTSQKPTDAIENANAIIIDPRNTARPELTPEDLVGYVGVGGMSDKSGAGAKILQLGGVDLKRPVTTSGGSDFPMFHDALWASDKGPLAAFGNAARRAAPDNPALFLNKLMGPEGLDQSHMAMDLASQLLGASSADKATTRAFDEYVRSMKRAKYKDGKKIGDEFILSDFSGMKSENLLEYLLEQPMSKRAGLIKAMDVAGFNKQGIPRASDIRMAVMDPATLTTPTNTPGRTIGQMNLDDLIDLSPRKEDLHGSYPANMRGEFWGGFDRALPWESVFPDYAETVKGKSRADRAFQLTPVTQVFDQKWLDSIMPIWETTARGWAEGGSVNDRDAREAAAARATMGDMAEYRRLTREQPRGGSRTTEPGMLSRFARGEWDRFSGPAKYNPALYAQDAVGRATSGMNVSHETPSLDLMRRNTQSDSDMLNDIVPLISPDMRFRDEYGPLAAPLDVMSIISAPVMAGGRGLGKIAQEAIKHARPALDDSLMQLMKMAFPPVGAAAGTDVSRPRFARGGMFDNLDNLDDFGIPGDGAPDRSHLPPMGFDGPESLGNESFDMMQPLEMMNMPDMGIDVIPGDNDPFGNRPYDPSEDAMRRKAAEPPKPIYQKLEAPKGGGGGGPGSILGMLAPMASMIPGAGPFIGAGMGMASKMFNEGGPVRLPDMSFDLEGGFGSDAGDDSTSRAAAADAAHVKEQGFDNMANVMPEGSYNYGLAHGGPVRYAQGGQEHAPDFGDNFKGIPGIENLADILGGIFGREDVNFRNITGEAGEALGTFLGMWAGVPGVGGSLGRGAGNIFSDLVEPGTGDVGRDAISAGMGAIKGYGSGFIPAGGFARGGSVDDEMLNYGVMNYDVGGPVRAYRGDDGEYSFDGQTVRPGDAYQGPESYGQRWRVDDMLMPAGEIAEEQMTPRMTYRGVQPTDYRIGRDLLGGGRDNLPFRSHWGLKRGGSAGALRRYC